ncbi:hypothetical protein ACOSQ4_031210 [Xanthoceras sorbifolium]
MVEEISKDVYEIILSAVIYKVNLVGSNPKEWCIDTDATRHICSDKALFPSFKPIENEEKLFMGTLATSDIKGQRKVVLKMTSRKELILSSILYVSKIRKNLIFDSLLNQHGFKMVFE